MATRVAPLVRERSRPAITALVLSLASLPCFASDPSAAVPFVPDRDVVLYLVVEPAAAELGIWISGHRVATATLLGAELTMPAGARSCLGTAISPSSSHLLFHVVEDASAELRAHVAPEALRPLDEAVSAPTPVAPPPRTVAAPSDYRVELADGWQLVVTGSRSSKLAAWARPFATGVRRLVPGGDLRCELRLTLDAEEASSLHHRLRPQTAILIRDPGLPSPWNRAES